jgi:hypothetical protein
MAVETQLIPPIKPSFRTVDRPFPAALFEGLAPAPDLDRFRLNQPEA